MIETSLAPEVTAHQLRDRLVEDNIGLAHAVASRYRGRGEAMDDLVQVALEGLVRAAERYSPEHGVKFSTFATSTMVGHLKHHFRDARWRVRVPRSLQERYLATRDAVERCTEELQRSPTLQEIGDAAGLSAEQVAEALEVGRALEAQSIDAPRRGEDTSLVDTLGTPDRGYADTDRSAQVGAAIALLSEEDRTILRMRFEQEMTQSQIADAIGRSQMQVSRRLSRSLATLRSYLAQH
ncbi:MAG TPA: sigma-70 family RNA polymerase sigma factor [Acidimicrobiales bacterium]|nr:sigma-70 family RNA polymerase sigma factor [Acidimicrobiales bacterium]